MQIKVEQIQFKLNKFIYLKCFIWLFLTIWNSVTQMTRTSRSVIDTVLYGIRKAETWSMTSGLLHCWCTMADHRCKHTLKINFFFFFLFFALYIHQWLLKHKQLPLLEISSISALKSVLAIRLPGSQRYDHHLPTVPVIDTKRTEQYKKNPPTDHILKWYS